MMPYFIHAGLYSISFTFSDAYIFKSNNNLKLLSSVKHYKHLFFNDLNARILTCKNLIMIDYGNVEMKYIFRIILLLRKILS